jgi:hypothetical protein
MRKTAICAVTAGVALAPGATQLQKDDDADRMESTNKVEFVSGL